MLHYSKFTLKRASRTGDQSHIARRRLHCGCDNCPRAEPVCKPYRSGRSARLPTESGTFLDHSGSVNAVPINATILVCPGTYPEQVTIKAPLTLRGVTDGTGNATVITAPQVGLEPTTLRLTARYTIIVPFSGFDNL